MLKTKKNISSIEQNKNTLDKNARQAIVMLDTSKAFNNDRSLIVAARELMVFYMGRSLKNQSGNRLLFKS